MNEEVPQPDFPSRSPLKSKRVSKDENVSPPRAVGQMSNSHQNDNEHNPIIFFVFVFPDCQANKDWNLNNETEANTP